ncbi:unnamed protein product [Didymodactylos carnosus]|uniref:Phosphomevalonate kinase n=1 Tax=Didymodactylos carnosus TaxID=1234261 RepID=A0A814F1Z6_9BILA|nr:unnamed protein product [Didymodactylos carnosus]CAF1350877.1 unnamed protein product [Didymodactylos carnosus]CAF3749861.1 unnamed protein product [Didymodactylos carnosus]CAF4161421.1 unnamed protein product [Didymodactylos carnosus]
MSISYSENLSDYPHKGKVGMPELCETEEDLEKKVALMEQMIRSSLYTVAITGAGVSTAAGIPDFRGPKGVWTLEKKGLKPTCETTFDTATPTFTHNALCTLERCGYLHFLISQNIDGLHHRSGFPLEKLAELHGNVYCEECELCHSRIVHEQSIDSYCLKRTGNVCNTTKSNGKLLKCRGKLRDTILDWEDPLPEHALKMSEANCSKANLCLCLGTSLQIRPCRDLPKRTKKNNGKLIIINLQKTSLDSIADLVIHERVDHVMKLLMNRFNLDNNDGNVISTLTMNPVANIFDSSLYNHVKRIVLLSGKRKSGKDYIGEKLYEKLNDEQQCTLLHLSEPLKIQYANEHQLNGQNMMDSSAYKETYRKDMIRWGETKRLQCPSIFCELAIKQKHLICLTSQHWIVCDIRRYTDIEFFKKYFHDKLLLIRIQSSIESREKRGFIFSQDIDDSESECQLDSNVEWNFVFINNENDIDNFHSQINKLIALIRE